MGGLYLGAHASTAGDPSKVCVSGATRALLCNFPARQSTQSGFRSTSGAAKRLGPVKLNNDLDEAKTTISKSILLQHVLYMLIFSLVLILSRLLLKTKAKDSAMSKVLNLKSSEPKLSPNTSCKGWEDAALPSGGVCGHPARQLWRRGDEM